MILDRLRAHSGKRQKPSAEVLLGRRQGSWLLGTALLTLAPHVSWLPPWIIALCAALLSWRGFLLWRGKQAPPHLLLLLLTVAAAAGVRAEFGHFFGKDPGVALLALLEVIFGILWAWWGANETPTREVLLGGALVIGALLGNELLGMGTATPRK